LKRLVSIVGGIGTLWGPVIGTILLETTSTLQSYRGSIAACSPPYTA
jgi:branched-chain amino acid transport system permease protein